MESMGTMSISEHEFQVIKKTYARIRDVETVKCRPKTRPTNKFHLNMKILLNPRLQEERRLTLKHPPAKKTLSLKGLKV